MDLIDTTSRVSFVQYFAGRYIELEVEEKEEVEEVVEEEIR